MCTSFQKKKTHVVLKKDNKTGTDYCHRRALHGLQLCATGHGGFVIVVVSSGTQHSYSHSEVRRLLHRGWCDLACFWKRMEDTYSDDESPEEMAKMLALVVVFVCYCFVVF